ncbi:phage major tail protein, TP901-1 family [Oharaeibacter diazotrophicus]|uniref:TP901-1 family phage major tail protein n=1 Tax=Oharaeibacter diazotrophicus TaxID=1920512 RepID=A0A4R6RB07_9HYPH|nr:phage major tail protein, TP901-1 family [Oharaeibacter diazotrophicus]TDP83219.1 TP901-1 family phage major tail protein [Oharaeibacter diazotrophicus]BBE72051.1 phage major tail protein 2 [Pleomorphomonas sp. SM30]GLS78816.1 tail protein [Oharaeibacter diazotrophicus]
MAAQKGRDLLLKVDATGSGGWQTVAGLRARRLAFTAGTVDVTDADSPGRWRELIEGAGVRQARISGAGIFRDAAADATVRGLFFDGVLAPWQVTIPDFGTVTGPFQVTRLDYAGSHDGEATYEIALESAGALVFAAP